MPDTGPTLYPLMRYTDAPAAMTWLCDAFAFTEHERITNPDGTIAHAELSYGTSILMLGSDRDDPQLDPKLGRRAGTGWVYVAVPDTDEHYHRAREAGAEILHEPHDTDYGSRDYSARDLEGNQWHFGTYRPAPAGCVGADGLNASA